MTCSAAIDLQHLQAADTAVKTAKAKALQKAMTSLLAAAWQVVFREATYVWQGSWSCRTHGQPNHVIRISALLEGGLLPLPLVHVHGGRGAFMLLQFKLLTAFSGQSRWPLGLSSRIPLSFVAAIKPASHAWVTRPTLSRPIDSNLHQHQACWGHAQKILSACFTLTSCKLLQKGRCSNSASGQPCRLASSGMKMSKHHLEPAGKLPLCSMALTCSVHLGDAPWCFCLGEGREL